MRSHTRTLTVATTLVLAVTLAACSKSSSSSSPAATSAAGPLAQAKVTVCAKLAAASTAITSAQAGQTGAFASQAASMATDLQSASSLLNSVGASDASSDVAALATDVQNLATAAPADVAQVATDALSKVTSAETALGCTRVGVAERLGLDPGARRIVRRRERHPHRIAASHVVELPHAGGDATLWCNSGVQDVLETFAAEEAMVTIGRAGASCQGREDVAQAPSVDPERPRESST